MSARAIPTIVILLAAALFAACDDDGAPSAPTSTSTPSADPGGAPLTGFPGVDAVIDAVEARDIGVLLAMVSYTNVRCISQPPATDGAPLCSSIGAPEGATIEALPISISEGEHMPRARVPAFFQERIRTSGFVFYGVLQPDRHPFFRESQYAVVFRATGTPGLDLALHVLGYEVVAVQGFGTGALDLPAPDDPSWIVPPLTGGRPSP